MYSYAFECGVVFENPFIFRETSKCINPIKDRFPDTVITSVYRSKTLNEYIGGSSESQHMYGYAADIVSINTLSRYLYLFPDLLLR